MRLTLPSSPIQNTVHVRIRIISIPLLACLIAGCAGRGDTGPRAGPPEAKELVRIGLEAWKTKQSLPLMASGQPLRFDDEDAEAGLKLLDYDIRDTPSEWSEEAGLSVTLSLRDRKGRPVSRHAVYQVTRHPELIICRDD